MMTTNKKSDARLETVKRIESMPHPGRKTVAVSMAGMLFALSLGPACFEVLAGVAAVA